VEAFKFTLGIYNNKTRNEEHAWPILGTVPNTAHKSGLSGSHIFVQSGHEASRRFEKACKDERDMATAPKNMNKASADYHAILSAILEPLNEMINEGMQFTLRHRGKLYKKTLVFYVHCIKCDGDEADKLTLAYRCRTGNVQQLCHYCHCPTHDTDNCMANCKHKSEANIKKLVERGDLAKLKAISQQYAHNAFHGMRFGRHNKLGIHGSCPLDMLHAIYLGMFKYLRECFFAQIGKESATAEKINGLSRLHGLLFKRQSERDMPKTNFSNGMQKGKLTGKEHSGVILIIAAILRSAEGQRMLKSAQKKNFREDWQVRDWILLVETLLQWEIYLKSDRMERKHVERLKKKHRFIMFLFKRIGNRTEGMGMKFCKFHAITHIAMDILWFGTPAVTDTGANESHHKTTKFAAQLTQKMLQVFDEQTARRLEEFHAIDLAMEELVHGHTPWEYWDGFGEESDSSVSCEDLAELEKKAQK
jgi:hypothetical protein